MKLVSSNAFMLSVIALSFVACGKSVDRFSTPTPYHRVCGTADMTKELTPLTSEQYSKLSGKTVQLSRSIVIAAERIYESSFQELAGEVSVAGDAANPQVTCSSNSAYGSRLMKVQIKAPTKLLFQSGKVSESEASQVTVTDASFSANVVNGEPSAQVAFTNESGFKTVEAWAKANNPTTIQYFLTDENHFIVRMKKRDVQEERIEIYEFVVDGAAVNPAATPEP